MSEENKAKVLFDGKENVQNILALKAHRLSSVNQEEAKQDTLDNLNQESCLIVMDCIMNYCEQMSEFFWKEE